METNLPKCNICKNYATSMELHYQVEHPDNKGHYCKEHGYIQPDDIDICDIPF